MAAIAANMRRRASLWLVMEPLSQSGRSSFALAPVVLQRLDDEHLRVGRAVNGLDLELVVQVGGYPALQIGGVLGGGSAQEVAAVLLVVALGPAIDGDRRSPNVLPAKTAAPVVGGGPDMPASDATTPRQGVINLRRRQLSWCPFRVAPLARFPTHFP